MNVLRKWKYGEGWLRKLLEKGEEKMEEDEEC